MIQNDRDVQFIEEDPDPLLIGILKGRVREGGSISLFPVATPRGSHGRTQQIIGKQSEFNKVWGEYLKRTGN